MKAIEVLTDVLEYDFFWDVEGEFELVDSMDKAVILEALRLKAVVEHPGFEHLGIDPDGGREVSWLTSPVDEDGDTGTVAEAYAALYSDDERKRGE